MSLLLIASEAATQSIAEIKNYYELLLLIMFGVNTIIIAALGFMFKKFFNDIQNNQNETVEIHRNQVKLSERVRSNKEILEQKINNNYRTLSSNIESLGKSINQQYVTLREAIDEIKNTSN